MSASPLHGLQRESGEKNYFQNLINCSHGKDEGGTAAGIQSFALGLFKNGLLGKENLQDKGFYISNENDTHRQIFKQTWG